MISQEEFYKIVDSLYKAALFNFPQIKNGTRSFELFYQPGESSKWYLKSISVRENYLVFFFIADSGDYDVPPESLEYVIYRDTCSIRYLKELYNFLIELNLLEEVFQIINNKIIELI